MSVGDEEYCMHELAPGTCSLCKPQPLPAAYRRPTTAPRTADDPIAPLSGTKDISISMYETEPYVGTDWLVTWGYPHDLRPNGWVYLRVGPKLTARARVVEMRWRDDRPFRIPGESETFGPGLVFGVEPDSWEPFDQDLGDDAERMRQGYRYHRTRHGVVHHLTAGDLLPDGAWDD